MRFIASKNALDSWHSQSLGVNIDKYLKKQKEYKFDLAVKRFKIKNDKNGEEVQTDNKQNKFFT